MSKRRPAAIPAPRRHPTRASVIPPVRRNERQRRRARGNVPPEQLDSEQPLRPRDPGEDDRIAQRREQVLQLRASRVSYREIARALGVSCTTVYEDEVAELAASKARRELLAGQNLNLHLETIQQLIRSGMKAVLAGNVKAITGVVRALEREAKLLGLDAPTKHELAGPGGGPIALQAVPPAILARLTDVQVDALLAVHALMLTADSETAAIPPGVLAPAPTTIDTTATVAPVAGPDDTHAPPRE